MITRWQKKRVHADIIRERKEMLAHPGFVFINTEKLASKILNGWKQLLTILRRARSCQSKNRQGKKDNPIIYLALRSSCHTVNSQAQNQGSPMSSKLRAKSAPNFATELWHSKK